MSNKLSNTVMTLMTSLMKCLEIYVILMYDMPNIAKLKL